MGVSFVHELGFLVSGSWGICFLTQQHVSVQTINTLANATNNINNFYNTHCFPVTTCITDGEFECLCPHLVHGINVNITTNNKHATEIKRHIHTIKECFWSVRSTPLPFLQKMMF